MSNLPFHQEQLEFMLQLTRNRIEPLDPFFRFLNLFDTPIFFFVLIPVVWLGFSYRWGLRIFYWTTLNHLAIHLCKEAIGWPRPSADLPEIAFFHPSSFGFPSGGAEIAMFLGGLFIYQYRTKQAWGLGLSYISLISFSRLYLGVHYPLDILGGWILAWIMLFLFASFEKRIESWLIEKGALFSLFLNLSASLILLGAFPSRSVSFTIGSVIGIGIGTYFSLKHRLFLPKPSSWNEAIGRSFIGVSILFLILFLIPGELTFFNSFGVSLFMSLAASPVCRWFMDKKIG